MNTTGSAGSAAPGLLGVVAVVEADADDLAGARDRGADALALAVELGELAERVAHPVEAAAREERRVEVARDAARVEQAPARAHDRDLVARRAQPRESEQFSHPMVSDSGSE